MQQVPFGEQPKVAVGDPGREFAQGFLWLTELSGRPIALRPTAAPTAVHPGPPPPARHYEAPTTTRQGFLSAATLGLGGVIGALVSIPPIFLAIIPPFLKQSKKPVDLGPLSRFPANQWMVTTFLLAPSEGSVARRTAYIRYNGQLRGQPTPNVVEP